MPDDKIHQQLVAATHELDPLLDAAALFESYIQAAHSAAETPSDQGQKYPVYSWLAPMGLTFTNR